MENRIIHQEIITITQTYYGSETAQQAPIINRISRKIYVSGNKMYEDNLSREEEKKDDSVLKSFLKFVLFERIKPVKKL